MIVNVNRDSRGLYDLTRLREATSQAFVAEIYNALERPQNRNVKLKVDLSFPQTVYIEKNKFVSILKYHGERNPITRMTFGKHEFAVLAGVFND